MRKSLLFAGLLAFGCLNAQEKIERRDTIGEVVVTGSYAIGSKKYIPLTISTVADSTIQMQREQAILPLLSKRVPGLFVSERGIMGFGIADGAAGQINIRGLGSTPNTQVLMMVDGNPQYMGIFGHGLSDAYLSENIRSVEIIRGPASTLYGNNAFGGVINIITKKQKEDGMHGKTAVEYGSYNSQRYSQSLGYKKEELSLHGVITHNRTDGHRDNSEYNSTSASLKGALELSKRFSLSGGIDYADIETKNPGTIAMPLENAVYDVQRGNAFLSLNNKNEITNGALRLYYNFGSHKIYDGFRSDDYHMGVSAYQNFNLIKGNHTTLGADHNIFGGKAENIFAMNNQGVVFGDEEISETGAYIHSQQYFLSYFTASAGLRLVSNSAYGSQFVPQLGITWQALNSTAVKLSYSEGYRSPTMRELYMFPPANDDLEPETNRNYEFSVLYDDDNRLQAELNVFLMEGENLIQTVFQNGGPMNINTGEFENRGVEFFAAYNLCKNISLTQSLSFLDMEAPVLNAPEFQGYSAVSFNSGRFFAEAGLQYVNNLYTQLEGMAMGNPVEEMKENYTNLSIVTHYKLNDKVTFYLKGENLTDQEYVINQGYPMPGITVFGGLEVRF